MDDRVPTVSRTPRSAESMHGSLEGGRRRRPSKEDLLPKSGEVRLRIASSTAGSREPSFNSRSRGGNFLAPTTAAEEESSLLSRVPSVGKCLVEGSVVAFFVLSLAVMACLPCRWRPAPSPSPSPDPGHIPSLRLRPILLLTLTLTLTTNPNPDADPDPDHSPQP